MAPQANPLLKKRAYYFAQANRIKEIIENNAAFEAMRPSDLETKILSVDNIHNNLEKIFVDMACELDEESRPSSTEDQNMQELVEKMRSDLNERLKALQKTENQAYQANQASHDMQANQAQHAIPVPYKIEVQHTDPTGNIPNVWGTFDGDYAKWKSFRDRWVASMHDNEAVKPIVKFQNLYTACVGNAKGALGEWDLTEENYKKAWQRLASVYEDDYMQVQSFMKKLFELPKMSGFTSRTIRDTIDVVQKHVHGLKRYVTVDEKQPYAVFAVINSMDTETYRAWEKYRRTLGKKASEDEADDALNPGKYIPTWKELERFLEGEINIRAHAEERDGNQRRQDVQKPKRDFKRATTRNNKEKKDFPDFLQCVLCELTHPLFKCLVFDDMNLAARLNHVAEHNLCVRCLRGHHNGPCKNKKCNEQCPKCPGKYHNSKLCPNQSAHAHAAFKTNEQRKRKQGDNKGPSQPKRRRHNNEHNRDKPDKINSVVHKQGDWSLAPKESSAIKRIKPQKGKIEYTVLLATVNMRLQTSTNNTLHCRAISDTGATLNCVAERYIDENGLTTIKCQKRILGVTGPEIIKRKIKAIIRPWFQSDYALPIELFILKQLEGMYPTNQIEASKQQIMHLGLADENFDIPAPIDAILGAEIYAEIIGTDLYKHNNQAIMQSTELGHIVLGKFIIKKDSVDLPTLSVIQDNVNRDNQLEKALTRFWEIENVNKCENNKALNEEEKLVEDSFISTYYREEAGRYVVTIPIKPNTLGLGDSRSMAFKQFMQLERRFRKDPDLKCKYVDYMRQNMAQGYMREASVPKSGEICYWIPHHAITKKFRVVLNASAKTTNGESLNSIQMNGPKLQCDSQLQTMRFRRHQFAVATDITKMFNRVGLNQKQWNLHRIFWRESESEPLKEYVMTVVIFGEKSSSYNSVRAMNQCATDFEAQYPNASSVIKKSFYMDDGPFGCDTVEELKLLCKEIEFVLGLGNFLLKGWVSNSQEVEIHMNASGSGDLILCDDEKPKILGLRWLKKSDELTIAVMEISSEQHTTKRQILSEMAKLYDPNGFVAPIIVKAKMMMQEIWKLKDIGWDDEVPKTIKEEWAEFYASLIRLNEFKIMRWLRTKKRSKVQIHGFCDACDHAYGTAIYVRVKSRKNEFTCMLLSAKSRVAPLKDMTTPRLELLAAVMLSEQLKSVLKACEFDNADITLWSDSMITLSWIKKQPEELKAFVANRVKIIQENTKSYTWKHVSSGDNPADLVSRGMRMKDFLPNKLWLHGPAWLSKSESEWPTPKLEITPNAKELIEKECKASTILNIYSGSEKTILYDKFHDLNKIINVTAYVLRFISNMCKQSDTRKRYISAKERRDAIELWIKFEQKKAFQKEINSIRAGDALPPKSAIASLRPILDKNGVLRVGGRIDKANVMYEKRHQYIIPQASRLSYLILKYAHAEMLHGGIQSMIQFIRREFWIPRLRFEAKKFTNTCVECVRHAQKTANQIMAELPEIRLKPAPPFQNVGVDMAGPYHMRLTDKVNMSTRSRSLPTMKGWIAVFVCLVTRAVHLEAVEGMSSEDFLVAYTKFSARRGNPEKIYSDNGTNFIGANTELTQAMLSWQEDNVQRHVRLHGTEWKFITPSAPHEGGIWEAAVKQMKHHLKRTIGVQRYSFQGMTALLASVEACLNSRPLCALSDDPEDQEALTPAHFLLGRSLRLPMPEKTSEPPYSAKRLYVQLQFQMQNFWKQWANDYLHSLSQLPKWRQERENIKIGQLVIIKADNIPPTYWAMARVTHTHKGVDDKVRSLTLKTQTGTLERSIRKVCVLPSDIDLLYWNQA